MSEEMKPELVVSALKSGHKDALPLALSVDFPSKAQGRLQVLANLQTKVQSIGEIVYNDRTGTAGKGKKDKVS